MQSGPTAQDGLRAPKLHLVLSLSQCTMVLDLLSQQMSDAHSMSKVDIEGGKQ